MIAVGIIIGVLLFFFLLILFVTHKIVTHRFRRGKYPDAMTKGYFYEDYRERYTRQNVSFLSGKNRLQGYIYGAENKKGLLVFAHGIGVGHESYLKELLWMVDHGWCIFTYDATGCCTSEGESTTGLCQSMWDLRAALDYVASQKRFEGLPVCLMGHSWGGYAAAAVLSYKKDVTAAVSLAGYNSPVGMMMWFAKCFMGRATALLHPFLWIYMHLRFGKDASLTAAKAINSCTVPVLVVHGDKDDLIDYTHASVIAKRAQIINPNAQFLTLKWEGQNGHESIFRNRESIAYIEETDRSFSAFVAAHDGHVTPEQQADFYKRIDRDKINLPNEELMQNIDTFLMEAIQKEKEEKD